MRNQNWIIYTYFWWVHSSIPEIIGYKIKRQNVSLCERANQISNAVIQLVAVTSKLMKKEGCKIKFPQIWGKWIHFFIPGEYSIFSNVFKISIYEMLRFPKIIFPKNDVGFSRLLEVIWWAWSQQLLVLGVMDTSRNPNIMNMMGFGPKAKSKSY